MYLFGVVVTDAEETPMGRASEALRAELPGLYPRELPQIGRVETRSLLFRVLASQVCSSDEELDLSELASPELVQTIQDSVNRIVAAAKTRSLN